MIFKHLVKREVAAHITVHGEEAFGVAAQNLIAKVVDASCRAKGCVLLEISVKQKGIES